jgi:hypothetical protein
MSNCNQTTCQLVIDAERRWMATHQELKKEIELLSSGLDNLIERVEKHEKINTESRLSTIEKDVIANIPKIPIMLDDLKKGQDSIFTQLGKFEDHDKRIKALEAQRVSEIAKVEEIKLRRSKETFRNVMALLRFMLAAGLSVVLVNGLITKAIESSGGNPTIWIMAAIIGTALGPDFVRAWKAVKGVKDPAE